MFMLSHFNFRSSQTSLTDIERRQLGRLVRQFSTKAPIRPADVFDLNYASTAAIAGRNGCQKEGY
jgi:hypothetical protein